MRAREREEKGTTNSAPVSDCMVYPNPKVLIFKKQRQKLGTFLDNKVFKKSKFSKTYLIKVGFLVQYSPKIFFWKD